MASTPRGPRRLTLVEAPKSSLTGADIASPYKRLAGDLSAIGETLDDISVPFAESAGYSAVTHDEQGNVQVQKLPLMGKAAPAYGRAVKIAALADGEGTARRDILDMRTKFHNDPDGFLKAATSYREEKIRQYGSAAGQEVAIALGRAIDSSTTDVYRTLQNEKERLDLQRATTSIQTRIEQAEAEAEALARNGDTSSPKFRETMETIGTLRRELTANPRLAYPKEKADADDARSMSRVKLAAVSHSIVGEGGVFEKKGYEEALKAAEAIKTDTSLKLGADERYAAFNKVVGEINLKRSGQNLLVNRQENEIAAVEALSAAGEKVPEAQLAAVRTSVAGLSNPDLTARMQRAEAVVRFTDTARTMRPGDLERSIDALDQTMAGRPPTEILAVKAAGTKLLGAMRKGIESDPLTWAVRAGVTDIPPIDVNNPASMRDRVARAETVAQHYGIKPTYLTPQETAALEAATAQGGAPMLAAARAISEGFGDRAPRVFAEVSKQAPVLAHMGALYSHGGSVNFLSDVAEAVKLRQDANFKLPRWLDVPPEKIRASQGARRSEVYGGAFVLGPDSMRAAEGSAQQAFFARAYRRNLSPILEESSDARAAYDRALQEAAGARFNADGVQYGGIGTVGGWGSFTGRTSAKVLVPANVRADSFDKVISAVSDADLAALPTPPKTADGRAYTARDLQAATPVADRNGYRFALGDPQSADPKWIRGADGNPFVLDFARLEPELRKRVPGAFMGGR